LIAYLLRRLAQAGFVMLVVSAIAFAMFSYLGDPLVAILGADSTEAQRAVVRMQLGLDRPAHERFARFLGRMVQGDFGVSYRLGRPVQHVLAERAPATIELAASGMLIALVLGIPAGIHAAVRPRGMVARALMALSLLGISLPSFVTGLLLIWLFSLGLGWLPSFGRGDTVDLGFWTTGLLTSSGLKALVLPAFTVALFQIAMLMRLVRAEMLDVLRADFIRFARARGISDRVLHFRHALRNTLVPVVTVVGLQFGSVVAFAVITESVFQWPGLGLLFLQSVQAADVAMMAAYLVLTGALFTAVNLVVDLLYLAIDPRLRVAA
jgi:peptide/nickel transport system permease protein